MERIEKRVGQTIALVGITLIMGGMTDGQIHWRERLKDLVKPMPQIEAELEKNIQEIPGTRIALAGFLIEVSGLLIASGKKKRK